MSEGLFGNSFGFCRNGQTKSADCGFQDEGKPMTASMMQYWVEFA